MGSRGGVDLPLPDEADRFSVCNKGGVLMESRTSIQSMALEIAKVANKVSNVLNMPVTVDQVVQISQILNGEKSVGTVATKTSSKLDLKKKVDSKSIASQKLSWLGFDFDRFLDGEVHVVTAQEIREFFGWGNTVKTSVVLSRFSSRLGVHAMRNGVKLRQKRIRTGSLAGVATEYQLY